MPMPLADEIVDEGLADFVGGLHRMHPGMDRAERALQSNRLHGEASLGAERVLVLVAGVVRATCRGLRPFALSNSNNPYQHPLHPSVLRMVALSKPRDCGKSRSPRYARSAFPGYLPPAVGGESLRDTPPYAKSMPCGVFGGNIESRIASFRFVQHQKPTPTPASPKGLADGCAVEAAGLQEVA